MILAVALLLAMPVTLLPTGKPAEEPTFTAPTSTTSEKDLQAVPMPSALEDDGFGACAAFQHAHAGDSRCFDNDDNPVLPHGPRLSVPAR
jgi:hypothetical protein